MEGRGIRKGGRQRERVKKERGIEREGEEKEGEEREGEEKEGEEREGGGEGQEQSKKQNMHT